MKDKKPSANELKAADQHWSRLEAQLEKAMRHFGTSRVKVGHVLYEMKLWLKKWGLNKGRRGRWQAVCTKHELDRKTAENWIRAYQDSAHISVGISDFGGVLSVCRRFGSNTKKYFCRLRLPQYE